MAIDVSKIQPGLRDGTKPAGTEKLSDTLTGPRFQDLLRDQMPSAVKAPVTSDAAEAIEALGQKALASAKPAAAPRAETLKFSNHALERIRSRGISLGPQMEKIENAVERAAQKGSKEALVLTDSAALIVNVKNRTVVTAMDKAMMKENVFTNIDSTVLV